MGGGYERIVSLPLLAHVQFSKRSRNQSAEWNISGRLQQDTERAYARHHIGQQDQCNGQAPVEPDQTNERLSNRRDLRGWMRLYVPGMAPLPLADKLYPGSNACLLSIVLL